MTFPNDPYKLSTWRLSLAKKIRTEEPAYLTRMNVLTALLQLAASLSNAFAYVFLSRWRVERLDPEDSKRHWGATFQGDIGLQAIANVLD